MAKSAIASPAFDLYFSDILKPPFESYRIGSCGHMLCEPGWSLQPSWSATLHDCDLWYVWSGSGSMELNDREIPLRPGVCIWMRPGGLYFARHNPADPITVTYIHFTPFTAKGRPCLSGRRLPPEVHLVGDTPFFRATLEKIVRLMRPATKGTFQREEAECLFAALVLELLGRENGEVEGGWQPHRLALERQAARIYSQPGETPSIRNLARELSLSPDHYSKLFRQVAGIPPRELVQRARVDRARQLLRGSDMTISEIADQLGYSDVFQFSRLFKQRTGKSPSLWRELA